MAVNLFLWRADAYAFCFVALKPLAVAHRAHGFIHEVDEGYSNI